MQGNEILKQYVCTMPFRYMAPFEDHIDACCGDWCDISVPYGNGMTLEKVWHSEEFKDFRQTILDGTYSHCNDKCPYKVSMCNGIPNTNFIKKEDTVGNEQYTVDPELRHIKFCSEPSCNLYCKSCRTVKIFTDGKFLESQLQDLVNSELAQTVERIDVLGSGDPFASKVCRNWLKTFDPEDFPNLQNLHIHTNGQLWTERMYKSMEKAMRYVHTFEVSIDAACEETYEKIRRGGSWKQLQENLNFILRKDHIKAVNFSFVIQKLNYTEIEPFFYYVKLLMRRNRMKLPCEIRFSPAEKWGPTVEEYENEINVRNDSEMYEFSRRTVRRVRELGRQCGIMIDSAL